MEGYWPIMFMLVVLKVPAIFMIYLLYWAAKNEPENGLVDENGDDGGGQRRPRPFTPRGPRRDPHGGGGLNLPRRPSRPADAMGRRVRPGATGPEPARARTREPNRS